MSTVGKLFKSPVIRSSLLAVLVASFLIAPVPALADGPNLLQNPGFEAPFAASIPGKENCLIAVPWVAWYVEGSPDETEQGYKLVPEYKMSTRADYPGDRVRSGDLSQQYFHSFGNFQAGIYQVVSNVRPGARYKFSIWAMTWSCDNEEKSNCEHATSGNPSPMRLRIGIDPKGGANVFDPGIAWSPEIDAWDTWTPLEVEAAAQNSTITVFVYSYPEFRSQDNNVYLDDASLIALAPPPPPTQPPTQPPVPTEVLPPTAVPTEAPVITNTLEPTAAPEIIATDVPANTQPANTQPANTESPTDAPEPAPTENAPTNGSLPGSMIIMAIGGVVILGGLIGIVLTLRRGA